MKKNTAIIALLTFIMLTFSACREIEITSTINADGTIDRMMEIRSDEVIKDFSELPFPVDSTWTLTEENDTTKDLKYIYRFKKHFENAEQINTEYKTIKNSMDRFERNLSLTKKFRFFYTYFVYKEEYKKLVAGTYEAFNDYLTDEEKSVRSYKIEDSLDFEINLDTADIKLLQESTEKKFEDWFEKSMIQEIMLNLKQDLQDFKISDIDENDLEKHKDTINMYIDSVLAEDMQQKVYTFLNDLFNTDEFDKIIQAKETNLSKLENDMEYIFDQTEFKYNVNMPGILLDTNADLIKGNHMSWQVDPTELFLSDKSYYAESRIINKWAFAVSGVFIILTILLLIWAAIKRKRMN